MLIQCQFMQLTNSVVVAIVTALPRQGDFYKFCFAHPNEPKRGGHVTITHQMLALTFRALHTRYLLQSDKKNREKIIARLF